MKRQRIEWAVVYPTFRGTGVEKGGLKSQEEAEAWMAALTITNERTSAQALYDSDAIVMPRQYEVRWREVDDWHPPEVADELPTPSGPQPHAFQGRLDRWCEVCNLPDRHPIHKEVA